MARNFRNVFKDGVKTPPPWLLRLREGVGSPERLKRIKYYETQFKAIGHWTDDAEIEKIYELCWQLNKIFGNTDKKSLDYFVVDHIVPVCSDLVCGLETSANFQIITARENYRKSNKYWPDMPNTQDTLDGIDRFDIEPGEWLDYYIARMQRPTVKEPDPFQLCIFKNQTLIEQEYLL